jgi:hypothetical protein
MKIHASRSALALTAICCSVYSSSPATLTQTKQLECSATLHGMIHTLKITVEQGDVSAFDYSSVERTTVHECRVSASKTASSEDAYDRSAWSTLADGTILIKLLSRTWTDQPHDEGTVAIRKRADSYRLVVTPNSGMDFCAPGAYMAPAASLTIGKSKCVLNDSDELPDASGDVRSKD